jgi:hypothetical protein
MYKKFAYIILLSFFTYSCGFSPIYSNKINNNFSIDSITFNGDRTINTYLMSNLKQFENNKFDKLLTLKINTDYKKEVLTKDKKAKITSYKLSSNSLVEVLSNNEVIKKIQIYSNKNMDNIDDKFEEEKYEKITKKNFAFEMATQIITELSLLDDF